MLAYAAHRRQVAERHSAPHAMLLIIAGHVALIAAVMSARMDLPERLVPNATEVELIDLPKPPPRDPDPAPPSPSQTSLDQPPVIVPVPRADPVRPGPPILLPVP